MDAEELARRELVYQVWEELGAMLEGYTVMGGNLMGDHHIDGIQGEDQDFSKVGPDGTWYGREILFTDTEQNQFKLTIELAVPDRSEHG
jgi:hypothetical protein